MKYFIRLLAISTKVAIFSPLAVFPAVFIATFFFYLFGQGISKLFGDLIIVFMVALWGFGFSYIGTLFLGIPTWMVLGYLKKLNFAWLSGVAILSGFSLGVALYRDFYAGLAGSYFSLSVISLGWMVGRRDLARL